MKGFSSLFRTELAAVFIVVSTVGCSDIRIIGDTSSMVDRGSAELKVASSEDASVEPLVKEIAKATVSTIVPQESLETIKRDPHSISSKGIATTQSTSTQTVIYSVSPEGMSSSTQASSQTLSLETFTPKAMLLDASSLESILRPVFAAYGQFSATDTRYFLPDDKFKLGEFSFLAIPALVNARIGGNISLSQDYIFALRTFAGRACRNLVTAERANPANVNNRLVNNADWTAKKVSVEAISRFMNSVFGYSTAPGAFHPGAQDLATVFNDAVAAANGVSRTTDNAMLDNYVLTCVYAVTDPRTFSR
jgi:hypothetical protein